MNEIVAIVEGRTELAFVGLQLADHLITRGMVIWPRLSGKSGREGGVKPWESAQTHILNTLNEGRYCTTMFDFYRLPDDWPGRTEAANLPPNQRGDHIEQAVMKDVAVAVGEKFNPAQFIPYIQVHEFEALTFADTRLLAEVTSSIAQHPVDRLQQQFDQILAEADGDPEAIDDGYETCPSRRITSVESGYRKCVHGPIVTGRIGIEALKQKCTHFAVWLGKLEGLAD